MSIVQFLKIFWARRLFILAATVSCLIGALIVVLILPARWEATTRVMLNILKPDPVTGEVMGGPSARTYVSSQIGLITDYTVARQVVDESGMLDDPGLIAQYNKRSSSDKRDFPHWAAQLVMDNTKAKLVQDSNILEISYTGATGEDAQRNADLLRKSYMDASLQLRREDAERNADWYEQQSVKDKAALDAAVATEAAYERANGVVMTTDKIDMDSARLQSLSMQAAAPSGGGGGVAPPSAAATQVAQIDAELVMGARTLGPNNPAMQALQARRAALAGVAAQDRAAARSFGGGSNQGAILGALAAQKAKVIAQSDKIGKLTQLQNDVDLRRDVYMKTSAKIAQYREEAGAGAAGIVSLGSAAAPKAPTFPNYILIIPGAIFLGFAVGVLAALLLEFFGRRVRSPEDLSILENVPLIGVIAAPANAKTSRTRSAPRGLNFRLGRRKAIHA